MLDDKLDHFRLFIYGVTLLSAVEYVMLNKVLYVNAYHGLLLIRSGIAVDVKIEEIRQHLRLELVDWLCVARPSELPACLAQGLSYQGEELILCGVVCPPLKLP